MTQTYFTRTGWVGLAKRTEFAVFCLCGRMDIEADSPQAVEREIRALGYTNGHPVEVTAQLGAQGMDSEWRCPECVVPCPRCRPDLRGEIYANRAKIGEVCDACKDEEDQE